MLLTIGQRGTLLHEPYWSPPYYSIASVDQLSNDPDKNYSIFYCSAAIRFPHIETVVFSDQELSNGGKQVYETKCILTLF